MKRLPPKNRSVNKIKNTLLVDGNSLYKRGFIGARNEYNSKGEHIGGTYQFITVLRKLLNDNLYHNCYTFWDGEFSGKLRWEIYKDYKSGRGKDYINGTKPEDVEEVYQRKVVFNYLEELFVRQLIDEKVESDDFIAYYCKLRKDTEKITVITNDRDLCQLIDDNVRVYLLDLKTYVDKNTFKYYFDYHYTNVVLVKMLCGDNSDSIKGIKRVGVDTLLTHFPQLKEREVTLDEIIKQAKEIQENRVQNKKKPLKVLDNIINRTTDGIQGDKIYEINKVLIDLSNPLLTEESKINFNELITSKLSEDDRSIKNAYKMLKQDGIDKVIGQTRYKEYLLPFKKLMEREKNNNI
jgi:5'-3' exonuclease